MLLTSEEVYRLLEAVYAENKDVRDKLPQNLRAEQAFSRIGNILSLDKQYVILWKHENGIIFRGSVGYKERRYYTFVFDL